MDEYKAYHFNSDGDAVNILSRHISDADADSLYSYITRDLQEYGTFDVLFTMGIASTHECSYQCISWLEL